MSGAQLADRNSPYQTKKNTIKEYITKHNLRLVSKGFRNDISLVLCYQGLTIFHREFDKLHIFLLLFAGRFVKVMMA